MSDEVDPGYRAALGRAERALALGRPNAALLAYAEAAAAAPDRSGPYVAMGALHLGAGRIGAAVDAFDGALRRSPGEPDALRGRAEALARAGRSAEAAAAFDAVAASSDARGLTLEAMIAVRRALELAESRTRRRTLAGIVERCRGLSFGDDDPTAAEEIDTAERLLGLADGEAIEAMAPALVSAIAALERADLDARRGDVRAACDAYLAAAEGLSGADSRDAALDACFTGLTIAPDDVRLHLAMAEIYSRAGWSAQLAEKAGVLARFLELESHDAIRARLTTLTEAAAR